MSRRVHGKRSCQQNSPMRLARFSHPEPKEPPYHSPISESILENALSSARDSCCSISQYTPPPSRPETPVPEGVLHPTANNLHTTLTSLPNELLYQIANHLFSWPSWSECSYSELYYDGCVRRFRHPSPSTDPLLTAALFPLYNFSLTCRRFQNVGVHILCHSYPKNVHQPTLLHWTLRENRAHTSMVRAILATGYSVNHYDTRGFTPLHCALTWSSSPSVVRALLDGGADYEAVAKGGLRPLHLALLWNRVGARRELLSAGAYVDSRDALGNTPLHYAVQITDADIAIEAVRDLMRCGGDVKLPNCNGVTPVVMAVRRGLEAKEILTCILDLDTEAIVVYKAAVVAKLCHPMRMIGVKTLKAGGEEAHEPNFDVRVASPTSSFGYGGEKRMSVTQSTRVIDKSQWKWR